MSKKNFFSRYIGYLKDNPKGYWFKPKLFGWGWTPATRQGWLVTFIALAYIIYLAINLPINPTNIELRNFFIKLVVSVIILLIICFVKGERPHWQWGLKD